MVSVYLHFCLLMSKKESIVEGSGSEALLGCKVHAKTLNKSAQGHSSA